jgi:hypothetical protein
VHAASGDNDHLMQRCGQTAADLSAASDTGGDLEGEQIR